MYEMSTGRHLAFSETENVTIGSAVPDNPTTELDIMSRHLLSVSFPATSRLVNFGTSPNLLHYITYQSIDQSAAILDLV